MEGWKEGLRGWMEAGRSGSGWRDGFSEPNRTEPNRKKNRSEPCEPKPSQNPSEKPKRNAALLSLCLSIYLFIYLSIYAYRHKAARPS